MPDGGSTLPRWLSAEAAAAHLCMTLDGFRRLVRANRLPQPSRSLGDRWPRWDRLALDSRMGGGIASLNPAEAAQGAVDAIYAEARQKAARRSAHAR